MKFLLAVLLSAQPNIFDPTEMSSEAIALTVEACVGARLSAFPTEPKANALILCGCAVDAIRLNAKRGMRPPKNSATQGQLSTCDRELKLRNMTPRNGKAGT